MKVKLTTGFSLLIAVLLTACAPIPAAPPPQVDTVPQQPEVVPALSPLEKAITGLGGEEALKNLSTLSIEATGTRWRIDEQLSPGMSDQVGSGFTLQLNHDVAGDNLRLDHTHQRPVGEQQISEIIAGELGVLDGQDARFGPPGVSPMTSDRWAAVRKQHRLLNPHLILRDVLADPGMASEGGEQLLDGSIHHLLVIEDEVAPITLYVSASTGHIAKAATMENDHLRRDVPIEVFYNNWQPAEAGLAFPTELYLAVDGEIVHKEIRSAIEVNQPLDSGLFKLPEDASPTFDAELAEWGAVNHQVYQVMNATGFPRAGLLTNIVAEEIAPGVYHVTGSSHHSLVIEQAEGIVVAEAPLHELRSEAVIDWIKTTFPDKPITHVIATHHHTDHTAGLRTYVAEGATVVLHEAAKTFFEDVFQAPSTVLPDRLALNPVAATIETVPADGSFTIPDATQPVEVYPIANTHAEDMVIIHVPNAGVVFVSDLYSPNPNAQSAGAGGQLLHDSITANGLDVSIIAGGHGATITFEDFVGLLGG